VKDFKVDDYSASSQNSSIIEKTELDENPFEFDNNN
jgi:hypothetical protein